MRASGINERNVGRENVVCCRVRDSLALANDLKVDRLGNNNESFGTIEVKVGSRKCCMLSRPGFVGSD